MQGIKYFCYVLLCVNSDILHPQDWWRGPAKGSGMTYIYCLLTGIYLHAKNMSAS